MAQVPRSAPLAPTIPIPWICSGASCRSPDRAPTSRLRLRADLAQEGVPAEHVAGAPLVRLRRGEDDVVGLVDGGDERVVVAGCGLLGELDVVDDRLGAVAAQAVDGLRVVAAR